MSNGILKPVAFCLAGVLVGYGIGVRTKNPASEKAPPPAVVTSQSAPKAVTPPVVVAAKSESVQPQISVAAEGFQIGQDVQRRLAQNESAAKQMYEDYAELLKDRENHENHRLLKRRQAENQHRASLDLIGVSGTEKEQILDAIADSEMEKLEFNAVASKDSDAAKLDTLRVAMKEAGARALAADLTKIVGADNYAKFQSLSTAERQLNSIVQFNAWLPDPALRLTGDQASTVAEVLKQANSTLSQEEAPSSLGTVLSPEQHATLRRYVEEERRVASAWAEDDKIRNRMKEALK